MNIKSFSHPEARDEYLREQTGIIMPRTVRGPAGFFGDFRAWMGREPAPPRDEGAVVVPADPAIGLAFPFPREELDAAIHVAGETDADDSKKLDLVKTYRLEESVLGRPTCMLSGGEQRLLLLSKAEALSSFASRLFLCSPTEWLFPGNYDLLNRTIQAYESKGKEVFLLLLAGEEVLLNLANIHECGNSPPVPVASATPWQLELSKVVVLFPKRQFPYRSPEKQITFLNDCGSLTNLVSPTLCRGPNGVGKSTLCKVLAGCIVPEEGKLRATASAFSGAARLVMQDCVDQLFGASPIRYMEFIFRYNRELLKAAKKLFEDLQDNVSSQLLRFPNAPEIGNRERPNSVVQAKLALVACRLCSRPPVLVLDEPAWELAGTIADAFVAAAVEKAANQGTATLIISHSSGYAFRLAKSVLSLDWIDEHRREVRVSSSMLGQVAA